jgi:hypothetical protein
MVYRVFLTVTCIFCAPAVPFVIETRPCSKYLDLVSIPAEAYEDKNGTYFGTTLG